MESEKSSNSKKKKSGAAKRRAKKEKELGPNPSSAKALGWPLHKAVWDSNLVEAARLIDEGVIPDINERDDHGNPPLHLAVHFRNLEMVQLLLERGADPTYKNGGMWSPIQEACAAADDRIVAELMMSLKNKVGEEFRERSPTLVKAMREVPDFYMEIHWEFKSWVPLVSRFCPYDTYKVWKKGGNLRVDTTLKGFENMKWVRGDLSIVFLADDTTGEGTLCMVDHDQKIIEYMMQSLAKYTRQDIERDVREVMKHSLMRPVARTDKMIFSQKYGWLGGEKTETVGNYSTKLYDAEGFEYVTRHRNNKKKKKGHPFPQEETGLTDKDKYFSTNLEDDILTRAWGDESEEFKGNGLMFPSDYVTQKVRTFKSTVWFTDNFPRTVHDLVPIFEVLSPRNKHFEKLKDFVEILPEYGFPVKIDIPVFPTVSGTASFIKYDEELEIKDSLFALPEGYRKVTVRRRPKQRAARQSKSEESSADITSPKPCKRNRKNNKKKTKNKEAEDDALQLEKEKAEAQKMSLSKEEREALEKVTAMMHEDDGDMTEYSEEFSDYADELDNVEEHDEKEKEEEQVIEEKEEEKEIEVVTPKLSKNAKRKAKKAQKKKKKGETNGI